MSDGPNVKNLKTLKDAAEKYFNLQEQYINNEYNFLDAISKTRGGVVGLQDENAEGASVILTGALNDYLGKPIGGD